MSPKIRSKSAKGTIGFDMGTANMMWGLTINNKFVKAGQIVNTIRGLADSKTISFHKLAKKFEKELEILFLKHKPKRVLVERFMSRGRLSGITQECVNVMIGVMFSICNRLKISFKTVTASSWKNSFSRRFNKETLNDVVYKSIKGKHKHYIDALLIAHYRMDATFTKLKSLNRTIKYLVKRINEANC